MVWIGGEDEEDGGREHNGGVEGVEGNRTKL